MSPQALYMYSYSMFVLYTPQWGPLVFHPSVGLTPPWPYCVGRSNSPLPGEGGGMGIYLSLIHI